MIKRLRDEEISQLQTKYLRDHKVNKTLKRMHDSNEILMPKMAFCYQKERRDPMGK
jgi:hypothetical protein